MQNLIPDLLTVTGAFTNKWDHRPHDVSWGEEYLIATFDLKGWLVLLAHLLDTDYLGVLKLFRLGVEWSLPSDLPRETVSKPDEDVGNIVSIRDINIATA
jgi:hypothetical protein